MVRSTIPAAQNPTSGNMTNQMASSVGNASQVPQNQNTSEHSPIEIPVGEVNQILEKDRLVREQRDTLVVERKEGPYNNLRENLNRKDLKGPLKKPLSWDKQHDKGQNFKKRSYSPPHKELVRYTQSSSSQFAVGHTPLRVAISEIYSQMTNKNLLPRPPCMRGQAVNRDKSRYCKYHREHGHDNDECRMLKVEIDRLIKRGYLKEFVDTRGRPQGCPRSPQRENINYSPGHGANPPR
ncbi:hypothetical protein LIER_41167 [Lithospermum erythrorhizon]|uniref:Reverse transcriptase domain-containing protein n=1 Tax=Lithospermum erythrorhizon TaxID=34254 RepID=A0AAV3RAV3_LITER